MRHLLFVYGTLMRGERAQHLMEGENVKFLGPASTCEEFYMIDAGFPALMRVLHDTDKKKLKPVSGHLFEIDDDKLARLDLYESNGHMYIREMCEITHHINMEEDEIVQAWVYVGSPLFFGYPPIEIPKRHNHHWGTYQKVKTSEHVIV